MEINVNTQKSRIITDNPDIVPALRKRFSYKVKGAEYTQAYRTRRWDGKKYFVSRTGIFRTGMLDRILTTLKDSDLEDIEVTGDSPSELSADSIKPIGKLKYRNYQEEAIRDAIEKRRMVIKAPTGSGKTIIMAGILQNIKAKKTLFLFNKKQLAKDIYDFFIANNIPNAGICTGEGYIYGDTMFCTVQSLDKVIDTHLDCEALFVDECHEFCVGDVTLAAIESFPNAKYRFGFSATPPTEKKQPIAALNLEGALGPVRAYKTTSELVNEGKLAKPHIQIFNIEKEDKSIDDNMSYQEIYKDFIVNNDKRNGKVLDIINSIRKNGKESRTLILVESLEHLENLKEFDNGDIFTLEGVDDLTTRYKTIDAFLTAPWNSFLIGTRILQTGINIEEITHLINARGLTSETATLQALGRALRKTDDISTVYIYDFIDDYKYLGAHSRSRLQSYKDEGHEVIIK